MLKGKKTVLLLLLLALAEVCHAQTAGAPAYFDTSGYPQWVRDLRRWEIVTFGSFPFAMFTATFAMDMYRWNDANGLDWSDTGRQYAPWPLKSAGAKVMTDTEQKITISVAAGLSIAIAVTDLIIVQVKRAKAKKRAEALPVGKTIINRTPWGSDSPDESESNSAEIFNAEPEQ